MLHADPKNPRARHLCQLLAERLADAALPDNLCVTVGGDGWMLHALHERGAGYTYLGINAGRVGFLLNDVDEGDQGALDQLVACIRDGTYRVYSFPLLQAEAWGVDGGPPAVASAINDVFVERMSGAMAQLRVSVGGTTVVEQLSSDGIVVATALGSTAYSFSAGGVPSHPMAQALHVTPICAHTPRLSPFVLPREEVVEIEVINGDYRPVRAFTDGIEHGPVSRVRVSPTTKQVRLAFLPGHDFTATMIRKILQA